MYKGRLDDLLKLKFYGGAVQQQLISVNRV